VQLNRKAMMRLFPKKQLSKVLASPSKSVDLDYSMLSKTTGPQLLEITRNSWLTHSACSPMHIPAAQEEDLLNSMARPQGPKINAELPQK
jgi:hypothetical protein